MPKLKTAFTVLLMTSLLGVAGCGDDDGGGNGGGNGGGSDAAEAQQVAEDYMAALNAKDDEGACELQTASSQTDGGCDLHSQAQIIPKSPEVESPSISGDRANVLVTGSGGSLTLNLVKEDGDWKVEEYQGQAK